MLLVLVAPPELELEDDEELDELEEEDEPEPPEDVAVAGAVVRFVRPGLIMRLVPGSLRADESRTGFWIVRFSLEESR